MRKVVHAARVAPIIAAIGDGAVQIWNAEDGNQRSEFFTVCDEGNRLALNSNGDMLVAANWRKGKRGGVACYDTVSGHILWHRADIGQIQGMKFSAQGDSIWCEIEGRPVHQLEVKTGSTVKTWKTVRDVLESPYSPQVILSRAKDFVLTTAERNLSIPRKSRYGLKAAFCPDAVCVAEAWNFGGNIRCLECVNERERWCYELPNNHFISLISYQSDGFFYAIQSVGLKDSWTVKLLQLTSGQGLSTDLLRLGPPPYYGGFGNGILVTPVGEVVSLETGKVVRRLDFE